MPCSLRRQHACDWQLDTHAWLCCVWHARAMHATFKVVSCHLAQVKEPQHNARHAMQLVDVFAGPARNRRACIFECEEQ